MDESTVNDGPEIVADESKPVEAELSAVGVVKSTTSGRIRLQLRPEFRTPEAMAKIRTQLEQDERVNEVTINERTGSVTVKFSSQHSGHSVLSKAIQEAELVGSAAFDLPEDEEGEAEAGGGDGGGGTYGKLDQQAADLMEKLDMAIYRRSGGRIHTRGRAIPLAIAGMGVAQMAIYGISLEMLPGPLLIWLAHDIHHRFEKEHEKVLAAEEQIDQEREKAKADAAKAADASSSLAGAAAPAAA